MLVNVQADALGFDSGTTGERTVSSRVSKGVILITDKTMFLAGLAGFDLGYELSEFKNSLYQVRGNKAQLDCFAEQLLREVMPDDWFPDSKDWQYSVWERAEIMKRKIESHREEIERLENWLEANKIYPAQELRK